MARSGVWDCCFAAACRLDCNRVDGVFPDVVSDDRLVSCVWFEDSIASRIGENLPRIADAGDEGCGDLDVSLVARELDGGVVVFVCVRFVAAATRTGWRVDRIDVNCPISLN